jgi:hypothetical protein
VHEADERKQASKQVGIGDGEAVGGVRYLGVREDDRRDRGRPVGWHQAQKPQ